MSPLRSVPRSMLKEDVAKDVVGGEQKGDGTSPSAKVPLLNLY